MPPLARKVVVACEAMPDGEVLDSSGICALLSVPLHVTTHLCPYFSAVRYVVKQRAWYGNPKTIAELKKQFPK